MTVLCLGAESTVTKCGPYHRYHQISHGG